MASCVIRRFVLFLIRVDDPQSTCNCSDEFEGSRCGLHSHEMNTKAVIGWVEYIDFPEWDISGVKAKIDTGARTSALHVEELEVLSPKRVRFQVVYSRRAPFRRKTVTARVVKKARVRSSTGEYSERFFVMTRIRIGEIEKEVEVSLVSRESMLFRMLLGRKALERDFLVDVGKRLLMTRGKSVRKKAAR